MRVIYRKIRHARYLYIKRNVEKVWGARYTLGARYLSKYTVIKKAVLIVINKLPYDIQRNGASKIKMPIILISTQSSPLRGPWSKYSPWKSGQCIVLTPFSYVVARTRFWKLFGQLHHTRWWCAYCLRTGTNIHLPLFLLGNLRPQIWRYWSLWDEIRKIDFGTSKASNLALLKPMGWNPQNRIVDTIQRTDDVNS